MLLRQAASDSAQSPEELSKGVRQLNWTQLPQGFKNSPTIFDEAFHEDLGEYRQTHPNTSLLEYVDHGQHSGGIQDGYQGFALNFGELRVPCVCKEGSAKPR